MYNSQEIAERIKSLAQERNRTVAAILSECGMGKNTISKIKSGTDILTLNFAKIADSLDCSVDYLLGREERQKKPTPVSEGGPSEAAQRFMPLVDKLTPSQQELLLSQLQAWTEQNQKQALAAQRSDEEKAQESDS